MHRELKTIPLLVMIFSLLFTCSALQAATLKEKMAARIPAINALKDSGLIGENNAGLLEYRTGQKPDQAMIQEENNDRQTVYSAISKKEGVSTALVGQRRAKMIAENGKSGHWFQAPDGKWHQK